MAASQALIERVLAGEGLAGRSSTLLAGLGAQLHRASDLAPVARRRESRPIGFSQLDRLLAGGLPKGAVVELVGRRSSGRFSLGLAALAAATSSGEPAAFVDLGDHFDPQAAADAGADLERVLLVRPHRIKQALAASEMLLSTGFALVVADFGFSPRGSRYVPDAAWVRLARSAQANGASLLLLAPWRVSGIAADTVLSAPAGRPTWEGRGCQPRLLSGLAARFHVEKLGHATPDRSTDVFLRAPDALPDLQDLHLRREESLPPPSTSDHRSQISNHKPLGDPRHSSERVKENQCGRLLA